MNSHRSQKAILALFFIFLAIKIILLLWSAHPFDFWSFVNTIQRSILYNWNLFEFWNKGNFLFILWYPPYSLYLMVLQIFSIPADNILLLHFFFKISFLFIDVLIGFLIYRIIQLLTKSSKLAVVAFFCWFINPIVFSTYGIHGTYSILIPLGLVLIVFGLLKNNYFIVAVGLVVGIQTSYFFLIFIPFISVYLFSKHDYIPLIRVYSYLLIGLIFSYIQLFFYKGLALQTANSILSLSKANVPLGVSTITIPPINLSSAINYLFVPTIPITNLNHPLLFNILAHGLFIIAVLLVLHFLFRCYKIFVLKQRYIFDILIRDLFLATLYFPLFLTNFQAHYLIWLIPFFIILAFQKYDTRMLYILASYTVIGFVYVFRGELGTFTFFLDITDRISLAALASKYAGVIYQEGMLLILLCLITILALIISPKKVPTKEYFKKNTALYFSFVSVLWILMLIPYTQVIRVYSQQIEHFTDLAYGRGTLSRGSIYQTYQISNIQNNRIYFSNANTSGSLVMQELPTLSVKDKENFKVFYLINVSNKDLIPSSFNGCPINKQIGKIKNHSDNKYYADFQLDTACLNEVDNYVSFDTNNLSTLSTTSTQLYITNVPVNYLYNSAIKWKIYGMAIIGLIYMVIFLFGTIYIAKRISNHY